MPRVFNAGGATENYGGATSGWDVCRKCLRDVLSSNPEEEEFGPYKFVLYNQDEPLGDRYECQGVPVDYVDGGYRCEVCDKILTAEDEEE